jgi:Rrf2 family transcriptional regulator, nitric oxide-sensitive transcriptional repressor
MISQTAEYALRAVSCLASGEGLPLTTHQVAQAVKVPVGYLSKVLQALGRAGLVSATRGLHGGFVLTRPASQISVLEVISAVDPLQRITTCPLNIPSHGAELCPLHRRLDDALAMMEETFRGTSIAELVEQPSPQHSSCCGMSLMATAAAKS